MTSSSKPASWFIVVPILIVGIAALVGAGYFGWSSWRHLAASLPATGTVVDLVESSSPREAPRNRPRANNKPTYAPLVEYVVDGKSYKIRGSISSNPPAYSRGERVAIRYLQNQPGEAKIDSFFENWKAPLILGLFGLIFTLGGIGLLYARPRQVSAMNPEMG